MIGAGIVVQDIKELSTEKLRRRIKAETMVLGICWGAVIICVGIALFYGKSTVLSAGGVGIIGLIVATIAMSIGVKKAKEEIARRSKSQDLR